MRIPVIRNIIIGFFLIVALDLFYLQVIRGDHFYQLSLNNSIRVIPFEGRRGRILDRDNRVLADNKRSYQLVVLPQDIKDRRALFAFVADAVGVSTALIEKRYARNRSTAFVPVSLAEDITRAQTIRIEENSFRFPGLMVLQKYTRVYPQAEAGGHVVGYVGKVDPFKVRDAIEYGYSADEDVGYSGVEEYYDAFLRGTPGGRQIEVNSRGRQTQLLSDREPVPGEDVMLTVDQSMQRAAHTVLAGRRGAIVVLDPSTGEVLAMVSSPAYDPNAFMDRGLREKVSGYMQSAASPLLNRALSGAFQPGSLFKIPVSMGGLEDRRIVPSTLFDCPGYFQMGERSYKFPHAWGQQDLIHALAHSANEYFFHTGLLLGREGMSKYARAFGLGERTGIDLPYEAKGNIPGMAVREWFKGDTLNMSIGQGMVQATPLQIARLMCMVETEGRLLQPYIVRQAGEKVLEPVMPKYYSFRKEVWAAVKEGLRNVVALDTGTAHLLAAIPDVQTYGKTGTAQTGTGREDHAWFAGVSRSDKKVIAYCVFLEHGGSSANAVQVVNEFLRLLIEQNRF